MILMAAGAGFAYASVTWTVEGTFSLSIEAPDGVPWTILAPQPDASSVVETSGDVSLGTPVHTIHATLDTITGTGSAAVRRIYRNHVLTLNPDPWSLVRSPQLSGRDGNGFWLWRSAGDPSLVISVYGYTDSRASRLGDRYDGSGTGFKGDLAEGWTLLAQLCCGDGVGLVMYPSTVDFSIICFVLGGVSLATGLRTMARRHHAA